ncbi:MAG TPA: AlkA N-terminal domain-containing protein [Longimicrobiales bacterium]
MLEAELTPDVCQRAVRARDPRFDGVFFVAITSTGVYCRPVCPARVTHPERRRFFPSAAAAEHAGYRPCLRCRPELAPGRALCDAVSRLADAAAQRIAAGALNGRSVGELARDLCVGERHLRRALERQLGVSPLELAQTHRLLLAKRLLADTDLPITRIAFASGFQSLRRFNSVFRERYRMPPNALRRARRAPRTWLRGEEHDLLQLTLSYRPPLAWDALLSWLGEEAIAGVEVIEGRRYGRTIRMQGASGVVFAEDAARDEQMQHDGFGRNAYLRIAVSSSLLPALMPLLAKLRQLFDLDAQPTAIDSHLSQGGLGKLARLRAGLRIPGALDGFDAALRVLLSDHMQRGRTGTLIARRLTQVLGEVVSTGFPGLTHLPPGAERIAEAGVAPLTALAIPDRRAAAIVAVARAVAEGRLQLEPGCDSEATRGALAELGVDDRSATMIVLRALHWPDAFPAEDRELQLSSGACNERALLEMSERWRPWRAYAALHLWRTLEMPLAESGHRT